MQIIVFAIVAFVLGGVIIMNRERIPDHMRRPLAAAAIFMVLAAFIMVIARFIFMPG